MSTKRELEELEEFFSEDSMEAITAMSRMFSTQQNIALSLTTLILDHCATNELALKDAKKEVFALYEEASNLVKDQLEA